MGSQIDNAESSKFQLGVMQNIEREMPKARRKIMPNWKVVMDYLLGHTSKGGSTSCRLHCRFLGVDPDGYSFWEAWPCSIKQDSTASTAA